MKLFVPNRLHGSTWAFYTQEKVITTMSLGILGIFKKKKNYFGVIKNIVHKLLTKKKEKKENHILSQNKERKLYNYVQFHK